MQTEWDNLILDITNNKKSLDIARQELSHRMYQYDAACRVICNLIKERDKAKEELANYKLEIDENEDMQDEGLVGEEYDNMGMYKELAVKIEETAMNLIAKRKEREVTKNLATWEDLGKYKYINTFSPLNDEGILCSDVHPFNNKYFICGGSDGSVALLSQETKDFKNTNQNILFNKKVSKKYLNDIHFYPSQNILGYAFTSADFTSSFYVRADINDDTKFIERYKIKTHSQSLTGLSFHPLQEYAIFSSLDGHWSFHNLLRGVCICKEYTGNELKTIRIHPDGGLFATGDNEGKIKLWDLATTQPFIKLENEKAVNSLSFSENGYHMASCSEMDSIVKIWDIRKNKVIKMIELPEGRFVNKISYDYSSNYLTIAGNHTGICNIKTMDYLSDSLSQHNSICTSINFYDQSDRHLITTGVEGDVKIHAC